MAARMRTAEGALAIIKELDPNTAVTLRAINRMVVNGEIPHVAVGRKRLINVDTLLAYLGGEEAPA